jgi:hypothetical protein
MVSLVKEDVMIICENSIHTAFVVYVDDKIRYMADKTGHDAYHRVVTADDGIWVEKALVSFDGQSRMFGVAYYNRGHIQVIEVDKDGVDIHRMNINLKG